MDGFRFILENPHPNASTNKQRKRARLVTACDSCRVKKIKCQQPSPNARCEACKTAKTPCLFGDRDRYQAERGVTCTWNPPAEDTPGSPQNSSRKRKMTSTAYPPGPSSLPDSWRPTPGSSSLDHSRSNTPAGGCMSTQRYFQPDVAGPSSTQSFVNEINVFPRPTPQSHDNTLNSTSYDDLPLFDPSRPRFPHPHRMHHLGSLFFDTLGVHFPFLDRFDVLHRIEQRTCSAILSNCIAGLAARFANSARPDFTAGAPFYEMAKTLAAHVVSVPSVEALHALICITWAEYSSGYDDGFWMYSRMAITMCLDLGLGSESNVQVATNPEVRQRLRLTWWAVVCTADIAASWATGRPTSLDLEQFDTDLPQATDDLSLMYRSIAQLFVLRGRLNRVLDAHVENQGESSLDWDLAELQTELTNMSQALPSSLLFNRDNLARLHGQCIGHIFVDMHLLIHAVSGLINRPSLLPSYGLPVPMEGPRVEAARTCAKALVDILMVVEELAPQALRDPFMDLSVLVASRIFIAESDAQPRTALAANSPSSNQLAKQWSDAFLHKCKDFLLRISSAWGGIASFDSVLDRHAGTPADDLQLSSSSSVDMFGPLNSNHHQWLLRPGLVDDGASDTSSSFRSSSRELSPHLASTTVASKFPFTVGSSPLVQGVDETGIELNARDLSFHATELFAPGSLVPGADIFGNMSSMPNGPDDPPALHLSMGNSETQGLFDANVYSRKYGITMGASKQSPQSPFSPFPWLTRR